MTTATVVQQFQIELATDTDCPECGTTFYGLDVLWEVTRYSDGFVLVEEYFDCRDGAPAGSPHMARGCGRAYRQSYFDPAGEQVL